MILLIDAYNVLKQVSPSVLIDERERQAFIKQLGRYGKKRQHKIILVFDGGPYDHSNQERITGVYVTYSGLSETADDYIKWYLKEHKQLDLLLVSSDRELRSAAAHLNIESMPAQEFYAILQDALQPGTEKEQRKTEAIKTAEDEDVELDQIMRMGSRTVQGKVEDFVQENRLRKSKAHRPSKKERKKRKKIKKL